MDGMPYVFLGRTGEADESGGGGGRGPRMSFFSALAVLYVVQVRAVWNPTKRNGGVSGSKNSIFEPVVTYQ